MVSCFLNLKKKRKKKERKRRTRKDATTVLDKHAFGVVS